MFEDLMKSPYAWLLLSICTIISLVFAVYTWFAGKKRKEFSVQYNSNIMIKAGTNTIKNLEMKFNGKEISDLTVTKFYIWNSGNDIINIADIVDTKPLSIVNSGDVVILDAKILCTCEAANKFLIKKINQDALIIDFDYVEPGEGILIQVLHTGDINKLCLECKVKGGKKIRNCNSLQNNQSFLNQLWCETRSSLLALLYLIISSPFFLSVKNIISSNVLLIIVNILIYILIVILSNMLIKKIKFIYHREIPVLLKKPLSNEKEEEQCLNKPQQ